MKYLKALLVTPFIWVAAKVFGFLYKNELKALTEQAKKAQEIKKSNQKAALDALNSYYQKLPLEEKAKLEKYTNLQNDLLKVYVKYCQEMQNVNGPEMEGIAEIWVHTVNGLNKTFQNAFSHKDDYLIKQHLYAVQQECQILIDSNQEILPGYKGPIGNA